MNLRCTISQRQSHTSVSPTICHLDRHILNFSAYNLNLIISVLFDLYFGYIAISLSHITCIKDAFDCYSH